METRGYGWESQLTFSEVNPDDYMGTILIGGRAPEYLRNDPDVIRIVRAFNDQEKLIGSICHGIQLLVAAGITEGRCLTCYEHIKFEVESSGGTFDTRQAVRDGHIVSAQTWESHPEFYREIFNYIES